MIPMMMMMMRPTARVKAVKTWNQIPAADRGEMTTMGAKSIRDKNAAGDYVYDKNGYVITDYDGLPDSDFAPASGSTPAGKYYDTKREIPYQDAWGYNFLFEDDVCFTDFPVKTTRPSSGYSLYIKRWDKHGCYKNNYFATTYVPYKTYDGSNYNIEEVSEVNGTCTVTMTNTDTGAKRTVTFNTLTDMDDVANRPTCQTGNVAAKKGTVETTTTQALKLAGHIAEPLEELLKMGSSKSDSYDPAGVRTRWNDGKTWTVTTSSGYFATCFKYAEYYYKVVYTEGGKAILDACPIYDYLTRQGGFINSVDGNLIFAHRRSKRKLKAVWDDHFIIPEEEGA